MDKKFKDNTVKDTNTYLHVLNDINNAMLIINDVIDKLSRYHQDLALQSKPLLFTAADIEKLKLLAATFRRIYSKNIPMIYMTDPSTLDNSAEVATVLDASQEVINHLTSLYQLVEKTKAELTSYKQALNELFDPIYNALSNYKKSPDEKHQAAVRRDLHNLTTTTDPHKFTLRSISESNSLDLITDVPVDISHLHQQVKKFTQHPFIEAPENKLLTINTPLKITYYGQDKPAPYTSYIDRTNPSHKRAWPQLWHSELSSTPSIAETTIFTGYSSENDIDSLVKKIADNLPPLESNQTHFVKVACKSRKMKEQIKEKLREACRTKGSIVLFEGEIRTQDFKPRSAP